MSKYKIDVTQDDINTGKRINAYSCPIALAMNRVTGKQCSVSSDEAVVWNDHEQVMTGRLPSDARRFVLDFDSGYFATVLPISFEIYLHQVSI